MENSTFKAGMTHAGKFHADDVFASALLRVVYGKDFKISRVRTVPEDVADDVLVFDIGGGKYDHHQNGSAVRKDAESPLDGIPYASFGLL